MKHIKKVSANTPALADEPHLFPGILCKDGERALLIDFSWSAKIELQ